MFSSLVVRGLSISWVLRIVLGLRRQSGLIFWLSLEVNLVRFIALLLRINPHLTWRRIKYFLLQRFGSALFLLCILGERRIAWTIWGTLIRGAIAFKLAFAPFQGWLVNLLPALSWPNFVLVSTVQKILPFYLFLRTWRSLGAVWLILGLLVRCLGGLQARQLQILLVYSSLLAICWILRRLGMSLGLLFLGVYSLSLILLASQQTTQQERGPHNFTWKGAKRHRGLLALFALLRISGIPPLAGFVVKILVAFELLSYGGGAFLFGLLVASAVFIWIYLRIGLDTITHSSEGGVVPWVRRGVTLPWWLLLLLAPVCLLAFLRDILEFDSKLDRKLLHDYNRLRALITPLTISREKGHKILLVWEEDTRVKGRIKYSPDFPAHFTSTRARREEPPLPATPLKSVDESKGRAHNKKVNWEATKGERGLKVWARSPPSRNPLRTALITNSFSLRHKINTRGVVGRSHPNKAPPITAHGTSPAKAAQTATS